MTIGSAINKRIVIFGWTMALNFNWNPFRSDEVIFNFIEVCPVSYFCQSNHFLIIQSSLLLLFIIIILVDDDRFAKFVLDIEWSWEDTLALYWQHNIGSLPQTDTEHLKWFVMITIMQKGSKNKYIYSRWIHCLQKKKFFSLGLPTFKGLSIEKYVFVSMWYLCS